VLGLTLMLLAHVVTFASEYPTEPVTLVIPFSAGGSIDLVARLLAQAVRDRWHQQ
jgi:tripartite-type tricarboxylate transporter receptor subunit TctC